jgi:hypothetical protein
MGSTVDPEEIIGYIDPEDPECLIPAKNWTAPNAVFHGQEVPESFTPVRWKDINDADWRVTV